MKSKHVFSLTIALLFAALNSHARVITLTVQRAAENTNGTAEVFVEAYEVAEVLSFRDGIESSQSKTLLTVIKDGRQVNLPSPAEINGLASRIVVAGPATLRLMTRDILTSGFCTVKITPESYPPEKSILVAPGSGGAVITLECSTNLVNWTSTTNGVYTNLPAAKFFRIKEERIPH